MCIFVWLLNAAMRMLPATSENDSTPTFLFWLQLVINTTFDLLPCAECIFFILYIMFSVPLKHLHFMSFAENRAKSLLTEDNRDDDD